MRSESRASKPIEKHTIHLLHAAMDVLAMDRSCEMREVLKPAGQGMQACCFRRPGEYVSRVSMGGFALSSFTPLKGWPRGRCGAPGGEGSGHRGYWQGGKRGRLCVWVKSEQWMCKTAIAGNHSPWRSSHGAISRDGKLVPGGVHCCANKKDKEHNVMTFQ